MEKIYQTLLNKFELLKDFINFNGNDVISYADKKDNAFFIIKYVNFEYIVQFQAIAGLKTVSHTYNYITLNNELAERLFNEFLDAKKEIKKDNLANKMNVMFLDSECKELIEDLQNQNFIGDLIEKTFEAYSYYSFLYLHSLDISFTCLYKIGTLKIKVYNREKIKNNIFIINLADNNIKLKDEFDKIIKKVL